jgi:hypothetical protein
VRGEPAPDRRGVALGVLCRERVLDLIFGATNFVCYNRDAPKNRATLWEAARLGGLPHAPGAAANNAVRTKDAMHE